MQMKVHNAQLFNMLPTIPGKYGTFVMYGNSGIRFFFSAPRCYGKYQVYSCCFQASLIIIKSYIIILQYVLVVLLYNIYCE